MVGCTATPTARPQPTEDGAQVLRRHRSRRPPSLGWCGGCAAGRGRRTSAPCSAPGFEVGETGLAEPARVRVVPLHARALLVDHVEVGRAEAAAPGGKRRGELGEGGAKSALRAE